MMTRLPLTGVKFSSTSIPSAIKKKLKSQIAEMGGVFSDDLMADVNVLIVGDTDTEKYRFCAKRRWDIKFLKAEAVTEIYDAWKDDDTGEMDNSVVDDYLSKPFDGLKICVSRIHSDEKPVYQRSYCTGVVAEYGGEPTESLLITTSFVVGTEKVGRRFEKAIEWGIPVVHPKWLLDSAMRGAVLEPKLYDITTVPVDEMGKGACIVWDKLPEHPDLYDEANEIFRTHYKPKTRKAGTAGTAGTAGGGGGGNGGGDDQLFAGLCFLTYGFAEAKMEKLVGAVHAHGGETADEYDTTVTHLLIPSTIPFRSLPQRVKELISTKALPAVNEWFIDRCLYYHELRFDSWSVPRNYCNLDFGLRVSVSGFSGVEQLHVSKLLQLLGCRLEETFNEQCDLLVINLALIGVTRKNSPKLFSYKYSDIVSTRPSGNVTNKTTKSKINAAKKWGIPVMSLAYLWQISEEGVLPKILDYQWCIFGPRSSMPAHNFLEYARDVTKGTFLTQKGTPDEGTAEAAVPSPAPAPAPAPAVDTPSRMPSPRKKKRKWGRLVGTAAESQLKRRDLPKFEDSLLAALNEEDDVGPIGTRMNRKRMRKQSKKDSAIEMDVGVDIDTQPKSEQDSIGYEMSPLKGRKKPSRGKHR